MNALQSRNRITNKLLLTIGSAAHAYLWIMILVYILRINTVLTGAINEMFTFPCYVVIVGSFVMILQRILLRRFTPRQLILACILLASSLGYLFVLGSLK